MLALRVNRWAAYSAVSAPPITDNAIIAIINSITGETDTTYAGAMATLTDQIGGESVGVIDSDIIEMLTILGTYLT